MTNDMDSLKTANAVAQKAEYYRERVQHAPTSSTFWGRNESNIKRNDNRNVNRTGNINRNDFGVPYNEIPEWYKGNPRIYDPNYRSNYFRNNNRDTKKDTDKNKTDQKIENEKSEKSGDNSFVTILENKNPFFNVSGDKYASALRNKSYFNLETFNVNHRTKYMVDVRIKSADTFAVTACVGTASYLNLFPLQLFKNLNGS